MPRSGVCAILVKFSALLACGGLYAPTENAFASDFGGRESRRAVFVDEEVDDPLIPLTSRFALENNPDRRRRHDGQDLRQTADATFSSQSNPGFTTLDPPAGLSADSQPGDLRTGYDDARPVYNRAIYSGPTTPTDSFKPDRFWERPGGSADYQNGYYRLNADLLSSGQEYSWFIGAKGRAFYQDDQRYEFTGCEQTFGISGVIDGAVHHTEGDWDYSLDSQFFLNEQYDKNLYLGATYLPSFSANFSFNPVDVSILTINARRNHLLLSVGRMVTPFGRFYYPIYTNNFWDSPFIRSDAILYRETGVLAQWDPEPFIATVALTNGGLGQDTNSSKALVARVGLYGESFSLGASIKMQDGIGSENQKQCNSHVGIDGMIRRGIWTLSGEAIIDDYGMNRAGLDPNNITWGRSIYFRDANQFVKGPLHGYGYYVNLERRGEKWLTNLNYGDYQPQKIGDPRQDTAIHRGLIKATRHLSRHLDAYGVALIENTVFLFPPEHHRRGMALLFGFEYSL